MNKLFKLFLSVIFLFVSSCAKVVDVAPVGLSGADNILPPTLTKKDLEPVYADVPYKEIFEVEGGSRPFQFSLTSGELPKGLTVDENTGVVSGKAPVTENGKSVAVVVRVTDALGLTSDQQFVFKVTSIDAPLSIKKRDLQNALPNVPYREMVLVDGGKRPFTFNISSGALPPGLELDGETGIISGAVDTTQVGSTAVFSVRVVDTLDVAAELAFSIKTVNQGVEKLGILNTELLTITPGVNYKDTLIPVGGQSPYSFTMDSGTLPSGLTFNEDTGVFSGTIPKSEIGKLFDVTVTLIDAQKNSLQKAYSIKVAPYTFELAPDQIPAVAPATDYELFFKAVGAVAPVSYSMSGAMPTGLLFSGSLGKIYTASGGVSSTYQNTTHSIEVTAIDANGVQAKKSFTVTIASVPVVAPLVIQTESITGMIPGSPFYQILAVSGGLKPYGFSLASGSFPPGITIDASTGALSGTPPYSTRSLGYTFRISVTDSQSAVVSKDYVINMPVYTSTLSPGTSGAGTYALPGGIPESNYSALITPLNAEAPYTFSVISGTLPSGLTLNSTTGALSGFISANEAGLTKTFTVRATDTNNISASQTYSITSSTYSISVTNNSLTNAAEGQAYNAILAATGGTAPYTFTFSGTLPSGIGLDPSGVFFGTPAVSSGSLAGTAYNITVRARDASGLQSLPQNLTLTVGLTTPSLSAAQLTQATRGLAYSKSLIATGGRGPYTYAITSGSLPTGLSLSAGTGVISGTPTTALTCSGGVGDFTVVAVDAVSQTTSAVTTCIAVIDGVTITTTTVPTIVKDQIYSATLSASGGTAPYTFTVTGLPAGIALTDATNGTIYGVTSAAPTTGSFYVTATDSTGQATGRSVPFRLSTLLEVTSASLVAGAVTQSYSQTVTATGGVSPYSFSISSGSLPPGLSLTTSSATAATISGTMDATAAITGTYNFSIVAADSGGQISSAVSFSIAAKVAPKILSKETFNARQNVPLKFQPQFRGGVHPFTWSANFTPNANGLSIDATSGVISGTPSAATNMTVELTVTDSNGFSSTENLPIRVGSTQDTINMQLPRFSEPCAQSPVYSCVLRSFAVGNLVTGNSAKYLVYGGQVAASTFRLAVARIDSAGRIDLPDTATNVTLTTPGAMFHDLGIADVDLDGHLDIIILNYTQNKVTVYWNSNSVDGNGMPTFSTQNDFAVTGATNPYKMRLGSLDVGTRPNATDIVAVSNYASNANNGRVNILKSSCASGPCVASRATIYSATSVLVSHRYGMAIDIADTNGDGCRDILFTGQNSGGTGSLWVRPQDKSAGTCQYTWTTATSEIANYGSGSPVPIGMAVKDLNNDTIEDIAVVMGNTSQGQAKVHIMSGSAHSAATTYTPYLPGNANRITTFCSDGATSCTYPNLLAFGGRDPLWSTTGTTTPMSVLPNSTGTFANNSDTGRVDYSAPHGQLAVTPVLAPIVSSNKNDLLIVGFSGVTYDMPYLYVLPARTSGYFAQDPSMLRTFPSVYTTVANVGNVVLDYLGGPNDTSLDLVAQHVNIATLSVYGNNGTGQFSGPSVYATGALMGYPSGGTLQRHTDNTLATGDFNNDGYRDIVAMGYSSRAISLLLGGAGNTFSAPMLFLASFGDDAPLSLKVMDVNDDGFDDVVFTSQGTTGTRVAWAQGVGDGTFLGPYDIANGTSDTGCPNVDIRTLETFDIDGDGRKEIAILCYGASPDLKIFRKHTDGSWKRGTGSLLAGLSNALSFRFGYFAPGAACVSTGGYSGKPCVDAVVGTANVTASFKVIQGITISAADAAGAFTVASTGGTSTFKNLNGYMHDMSVADFDRDGHLDVVFTMGSQNSYVAGAAQTGNILYICRGTGDSEFAPGPSGNTALCGGWGMQSYIPSGVATGDINNDGKVDLIEGFRVGQRIAYEMISTVLNLSE